MVDIDIQTTNTHLKYPERGGNHMITIYNWLHKRMIIFRQHQNIYEAT